MSRSDASAPPFALVIFDCDGVLVDSEPLSCKLLSAHLAAHGLEADVGYVKRHFLGRSLRAVRAHAEALGTALPADFEVGLNADLLAHFAAGLRPIPGIASLLAQLARAGLPMCAASSSHLQRVRLCLETTGLARFFGAHVYTTEMVARGKPAPDVFLHAAARLQTPPERCVVIEDSISGVRAGAAAGMTVWGFVGGSHHSADATIADALRGAGAARVFSRMDAIAAALPATPTSTAVAG